MKSAYRFINYYKRSAPMLYNLFKSQKKPIFFPTSKIKQVWP